MPSSLSCRQLSALTVNDYFPRPLTEAHMNGQEAFRRFAQQLQRAQQSRGSRLPGGNRGFFAGGGLLVALVGGGVLLNASLFNGMSQACLILKSQQIPAF